MPNFNRERQSAANQRFLLSCEIPCSTFGGSHGFQSPCLPAHSARYDGIKVRTQHAHVGSVSCLPMLSWLCITRFLAETMLCDTRGVSIIERVT